MFSKRKFISTVVFWFGLHFMLTAQPTASFNINYPNPVCNPSVISFSNLSTGVAPLSYAWNFGVTAGVNSVQTNPSITYLNCGTFNVTLTVTDGNGQTNTVVQPVTIHCSPTVSFTVNQSSGCIPLAVQFVNTSIAGSGTITSYAWDFGDGFSSTSVSPLHTYLNSGCKNVTLTITNSFGCTSNFTMNNAVCVSPKPTANFTSPVTSSCSAPFTASYIGSPSGGTGPYSYQWSFPGGAPNSSTSANPSVTYNSPGSFNAQLIITDANGCKDTLLQNAWIVVGNNTTNFSINALSACTPATFNVNGTGNPAPSNFAWTTTPAGSPATSNNQNASFTFATQGSYQICLSSTFSSGCVANKCTTVTVLNTPLANFSATGNTASCSPPQTIHFTNTSSGAPTIYSWSFTGGTPATFNGANPPNITYSNCGNFPVSLTVTSANGCSNNLTQNNFININCPVASFTALPTFGCIPVTTQFNSTGSTGQPTIWNWNFGDPSSGAANTSNQQNPTHTYNTPGCYTVTLVTNNPQGCGDTETQTNLVCVGSMPVANFSSNPPVSCANNPISFTNLSTNVFPYTTYSWDFEGVPPFDNQSNATNPTHQYSDTGWFDVSLIACNNGCCDTLIIVNMEHILPPIAKIVATQNCNTPFNVHFDGTSSIGANTYTWSFPGASPSSSTNSIVNVVYATTGNYTATLTVFNTQTGCSYTSTQTIYIRNLLANFTATPLTGCAPQIITLTSTSVDALSVLFTVTNASNQTVFTTTNPVQGFILPNPGTYSVQLIATDINGCRDTLYHANYITINGFNIAATAAPGTGCVPLVVHFTDASTSTNSTAVGWQWNFGDPLSGGQNTSNQHNPNHTYVHSGVYNVTLSITDNHGCVSTATIQNLVNVIQPVANFSAIDSTICFGSAASFFNYSAGNQLSFLWNFGDNSTSTQANPNHNYLVDGLYQVTLVVTDNLGCKDTIVKPQLISVVTANFTANVTSAICPILPVQFTSLSTGVDPNTTYVWDFGDGSMSTVMNPSHTYVVAGNFDVTLMVTNQYGCTDTLLIPQYIQIGGPIATVTFSPQSGCAPVTVCFYVVTPASTSIVYDFGDGVVMAGPDTMCYTYTLNGIFHPQVILSNGINCTYAMPLDSIVISVPTTIFSSTSPVCDSGNVQFTNLSTSNPPIVSSIWNFGDPGSGANNTSVSTNPSHFYSSLGTYYVTLVSTNQDGCVSQNTDSILVVQSPHANFTLSSTALCQTVPISFADNSSSQIPIASYSWNFGDPSSGASNLSSLQNPTHTYLNAGTYFVSEIISNQNGCIDSIIIPLIIHSNPTVSLASNFTICYGGSVNLNASGGSVYLWSPAVGLSSDTIANPIANPFSNTTYQVLVTDSNGCTTLDSTIVSVNQLPVISAGTDSTLCMLDSIMMNGSGGVNYNWLPVNGLSNPFIANPMAAPLTTTTYTVSGTDINGCFGSDTVILIVLPLPIANAGMDAGFCVGDSVQLNASGGISYQWFPPIFINDDTIFNPIVNPPSSLNYFVLVTDSNGCGTVDSVFVTVHPLPNIIASALDSIICLGTSTLLNASGGVSYVWSPNTFLNNPFLANPVCTPSNNMTYYLTGTDQFGCVNDDSTSVMVQLPITVSTINDTSVCAGQFVQLFASGAVIYQWTPVTGLDNPNSPNPLANPSVNTTYMIVGSDNICFHDTTYVTVIVNPNPVIDAGPNQTILSGETATLQAVGDSGVYHWDPSSGLSCDDCLITVAKPNSTTQFTIEVTNEFGCKASDSVTIFVICNNTVIFVPNAFTPNDDGKNDVFYVRSNGVQTVKFFRVYDRWGALIFETANLNEGWDGTFKGEKVRPDVFVYHLDVICNNGDEISEHGNVTVIR